MLFQSLSAICRFSVIVVFHAGIGQDFSLPFLDPTPEDVPSTYVDSDMILEHLGTSTLSVGNHEIEHGIILPETQNHLLCKRNFVFQL